MLKRKLAFRKKVELTKAIGTSLGKSIIQMKKKIENGSAIAKPMLRK